MALRARCSEGQCVDVGKVGHTEEYRTRPGCDTSDRNRSLRCRGFTTEFVLTQYWDS